MPKPPLQRKRVEGDIPQGLQELLDDVHFTTAMREHWPKLEKVLLLYQRKLVKIERDKNNPDEAGRVCLCFDTIIDQTRMFVVQGEYDLQSIKQTPTVNTRQ